MASAARHEVMCVRPAGLRTYDSYVTVEDAGESAPGLRAIVCDDGALNRDCLALALTSHGIDVECAWDLPSFLSRLEAGAPDVILLNAGTPDLTTLIQISLDVGPGTRVIVIGLSADAESDIVTCAEAGVAGLHLRTESLDQLLNLIHRTGHETPVCSAAIAAILMRRVYALAGQPNLTSKNLALTDRERQILRLLGEGLSNQQIASRLCVSVHTVKNHVHSLFGKLGVSSRAEAVAVYRATAYSDFGTLSAGS